MITHIILLGMMGSGKTTVGKELSLKLKLSHIDLDDYIALENKQSFQDFFNLHSMENFRIMEEFYLRQLLQNLTSPTIISLGGGTLSHKQDLSLLADHTTIYLRCPLSTLMRRLKTAESIKMRPLLASLDDNLREKKLQEIINNRQLYYEKAKHIFDNDEISSEDAVKKILTLISL